MTEITVYMLINAIFSAAIIVLVIKQFIVDPLNQKIKTEKSKSELYKHALTTKNPNA